MRAGAISVRKSAIRTETGMASRSAMTEVTSVPKMKDSPPN